MPVFEYKAIDLDQSVTAGAISADTPRQARDQLRQRGLTVASLRAAQARKSWLPGRRGRRSQGTVVAFVSELSTLLRAGIGLLPALQTLHRQHRGGFRAAVQHICDDVSAGMSLADAMDRQNQYFDEMCVSIVRVGEKTGSLDEALGRLSQYKEKTFQLHSKVTTALIYPAVVCVIGLGVTAFLMTFVVPNLLETLTTMGRSLPTITLWVKGISDFLVSWWWLILIVLGAIGPAIAALLRTDRGSWAAHWAILRVPLIGPLARMETTSRMAVVLSSLLRSGLQFVEAIRITRGTINNRIFRSALEQYEKAVTEGRDVAEPLAASKVFSPLVVQIVAVGQQAGELERMLEQLAESYDRQVAIASARLAAVLEPLMIVLLAALVGFVALATILPILEVSNVM